MSSWCLLLKIENQVHPTSVIAEKKNCVWLELVERFIKSTGHHHPLYLIVAKISASVTVVVAVGVARVSVASVPGWVLIERKKKKAS